MSKPFLLTGKVKKKPALTKILDTLKDNPRVAEFGIGFAPGSVAGAAIGSGYSEKENKRRNAIIGGITGGIAGGAGAVGANRLALRGVGKVEGKINPIINKQKEQVRNVYDTAYNPPNLSEERLYDAMFDKKEEIKDAINFSKRMGNKKLRKGQINLSSSKIERRKEELAQAMANIKARGKFKEKFIDGIQPINVGDAHKNKVFGGVRGMFKLPSKVKLQGAKESELQDALNQLNTDSMFASMFGRQKTMGDSNFYTHRATKVNLDDIKNSKEYREAIRQMRAGVNKDFKANTRGNFFDERIREKINTKVDLTREQLGELGSRLGFNPSAVKRKKDIERAYKNMAKKYHPDLNRGRDKSKEMSEINEAIDRIKNSSWFEKLAYYKKYN